MAKLRHRETAWAFVRTQSRGVGLSPLEGFLREGFFWPRVMLCHTRKQMLAFAHGRGHLGRAVRVVVTVEEAE